MLGRMLIGEAELEYRHQEFKVLKPGNYVVCAVSGERIPLNRLVYWNVGEQVPFKDAEAARMWMKLRGMLPKKSELYEEWKGSDDE